MKIRVEIKLDNKIYTDKIVNKILELQEIINELYSHVEIENSTSDETYYFTLIQTNEIPIRD